MSKLTFKLTELPKYGPDTWKIEAELKNYKASESILSFLEKKKPKPTVVGVILIAGLVPAPEGNYADVVHIKVDKPLRGHKIGKQLYVRALKEAKAKGLLGISSQAEDRNENSERFWKKYSEKQIFRDKKPYGNFDLLTRIPK